MNANDAAGRMGSSDDSTSPEERLREAFRVNRLLDLRPRQTAPVDTRHGRRWGVRRQISAGLIARLLCSPAEQTADGSALRLVGARITGTLDLRHARIRHPLIVECCYFDEPVDLTGAHAPWLSLCDCGIPGLIGYRLRVEGDLDLHSLDARRVDLTGAHIGGRLRLDGSRLQSHDGGFALVAPEVTVSAEMYCREGFSAKGGANLDGASIGSSLEFQGASLTSPVGNALSARGLSVRADARLADGFNTAGGIDLFGAQIGGQLWLNGANLDRGEAAGALNAPQIKVSGGMYCGNGFSANGRINLYGANIGSTLAFSGATLTNPSGKALRAPGLTVGGDLHLDDGFVCTGAIDLFGAEVKGQVWLTGARLNHGEENYALNAPLLRVGGGMYCHRDFSAEGGINLYGATIGSILDLSTATLNDPGGSALRAPGLTVEADVLLRNGVTTTGAINLSRAVIRGALDIDQAILVNSTMTMNAATIGTVRGTPSSWPENLRLINLTYTSVEPYLPAARRLLWLRSSPDSYHPQPYEQLARYYRSVGHDEQARIVLLAKQRHRRRELAPLARIWGYLQDVVVGYGYRPTRALLWLLALVATTSGYFHANPPRPNNPAGAPTFQPVIYSLDILIPVLGLGQKSAYSPTGAGQWVAWTATLSGWILATTIVAALTRALSRN